MEMDLPFIWAAIIAFAIFMYVVLDGFDLGVGILFPTAGTERQRDAMIRSIAPVWDGNETWLIMGGSGLFAAFPLAYSIVLPALYVPVLVMLLALVFRGVAFEYRERTSRLKSMWNVSFFSGSLVAALMQGIILGALVQGIETDNRVYTGGWWDWLTPFSMLTGTALAAGYALLGATWLVMKTQGDLQNMMRDLAWYAGLATLGFIAVISLLTPFQDPVYFARWFAWPTLIYSLLVPAAVAVTASILFAGLARKREATPFLSALALFALGFAGIGISFYPYILPPSVTIWEAAASQSSLGFTLVGAAILLPVILGYTGYSYWIFRGKAGADAGYH